MSASSHAAFRDRLLSDGNNATVDAALAGAYDVGEGHGERRACVLEWIDRCARCWLCIGVLCAFRAGWTISMASNGIEAILTGYLPAVHTLGVIPRSVSKSLYSMVFHPRACHLRSISPAGYNS